MGRLMSESSTRNILLERGYRASCHRAWIEVEIRKSATVLSLGGEIDAATLHFLESNTRRFLGTQTPLVVSTSSLRYFSVGSVRALLDFNMDAHRESFHWALVNSEGLRRPLEIADHCAALPVVDSAAAAFARVTALQRSAPRASPVVEVLPALQVVR